MKLSFHRFSIPLSRLFVLGAAGLLSGCAAVGPDYQPPELELPDRWTQSVRDEFSSGEPALEAWWKIFDDPVLDQLIEDADAGNLGLQVALSRIQEARSQYAIARGEYVPQIDGAGSAGWTRVSEGTAPTLPQGLSREDTLFSLGIGVAWELDFWGRIRRSVESADASYASQLEAYRDTLVVLYADVAATYFELRSLQERILYALRNAAAQRETLDLTRSRSAAGLAPDLDVRQAELNLAVTSSAIPALRAQLVQAKNRLAVLSGQAPGTLDEMLSATLRPPDPPPEVLVDVPANVLRQRPDIRKAERDLAAQHARIGVATAALYPTFALPGAFTLEAFDGGDLLDSGSLTYGFGPAFQWNLFSGGRIRNAIEVESARTEQLLVAYEQTVLLALEEVENSMAGLAEERVRHGFLLAAVDAAQASVDLVKSLYRTGLTDFQNVLDMERELATQQDRLANSRGVLGKTTVRLYKSLGGGWQHDLHPPATGPLLEEKNP